MIVTDDLADNVAPLSSRLRAIARARNAGIRGRARRRADRRRAARARATSPGSSTRRGRPGRPKGVMLTHRNLATMTACYFIDVDDVDAGRRDRLRRADVARRRALQPAVRRARGAPRRSRVGRLRSGRAGRALARRRPALPVRGADDGAAPRRARRRQRRAVRRLQDHRLRRRPDVRRRTSGARWRRWARASSRSTARASRR